MAAATPPAMPPPAPVAVADETLADEKAIARAALEPAGLPGRPPTLDAPPPGGPTLGAPLLAPPGAKPGLSPGSVNPLTGLRVPTPELAAAFLASNPTPPASAAPAPATAGGTDVGTATADDATRRDAAAPKLPRKKHAKPESILMVVGGVLAVVLGGGLTAAYLFLRSPAKSAAPSTPQEEVAPEAVASSESTPAADPNASMPPAAAPGAPAAGDTPTGTGVSTETGSNPGEGAAPATDSAAPDAQVVAPVQPAAPPPPPPRVNRPDPTILAWVQKIQLTGIRSGPPPKVYMNGKLYEIGETVNYDLDLKLTAVTGKVLHFEDAGGNTYEYRF